MFADIFVGGFSLVNLLIAVVVIAACCALVCVALRQFGVSIPPWVVQIMWIVIVAFVVIVGIKFVASL